MAYKDVRGSRLAQEMHKKIPLTEDYLKKFTKICI
jgi:hypothetical protein